MTVSRRHGETAWRRGARALRRLLGSTADVRARLDAIEGAQRPITTGRRIAVVGVRGGGGRSTVTALVAEALAGARADAVLALDADGNVGSLGWRLGVPAAATPARLVDDLRSGRLAGTQELSQALPHTASGLLVLSQLAAAAGPRSSVDVMRALSRYVGVIVIDCSVGLTDPAVQAVVADAHAVILVTPNTVDGVRSTRSMLDQVAEAAGRRIVLVLNCVNPLAARLAVATSFEAGREHGVAVLRLPYDRHLAVGSPVEPRLLGDAAKDAAAVIAAEALARATVR